MVVDGVATGRWHLCGLIGREDGGIELGRGPHGECLFGHSPGAFLDGTFIPDVELPEPRVEPEQAVLQTLSGMSRFC